MSRPSILIVDDDAKYLALLNRYLSHCGFSVVQAASPLLGLEIFERNRFDAVVIDKMMPEMDGVDLCRLLREKSVVPIILISADNTSETKNAARSAGATLFLSKPFSPAFLVSSLTLLFREGRSGAPSYPATNR